MVLYVYKAHAVYNFPIRSQLGASTHPLMTSWRHGPEAYLQLTRTATWSVVLIAVK